VSCSQRKGERFFSPHKAGCVSDSGIYVEQVHGSFPIFLTVPRSRICSFPALRLPCSSAGERRAAGGYHFTGVFFFPLQQNTPQWNQQRGDEHICDTSGNVLFQLSPCSSATKSWPQRYRGDLSVGCCESSLALIAWPLKSRRVGLGEVSRRCGSSSAATCFPPSSR